MNKKLVSIVSPAFNESKNIPLMVKEVADVFKNLPEFDYEYIFVDDGSIDDTWSTIVNQSKNDNKIKGIKFSRNFGHQIALTAGLDYATGEVIIYLDSDLQQPPSLFPSMLQKWKEGYKVVHTHRLMTEDEPFAKKTFSKLFYKLINYLSDTPINEGMADFKLIDRSVLDSLKRMKEHNRFLRGMVPWMGFRSTVLEYTARKRIHGKPWYNFRRNISFAKQAILSFSAQPLRYIGYLGVFITGISLFIILANSLWWILYLSSYLSIAVLIGVVNTFFIGLVMSSLGVIALYLNFVYEEVINRPLYLVEDVTTSDNKVN